MCSSSIIKLFTVLSTISLVYGQVHLDESWAQAQYKFSQKAVLSAIKPKADAYSGTIMASPTIVKPNPDYYYHWVRDAGLTMDALAGSMEFAESENERHEYYTLFENFNNLTARLQNLPIPKSLEGKVEKDQWFGEPKYNMDATPYEGDWMRPQNDGPAIRASATVRYTRYLLHRYEEVTHLYNATIPRPLNRDLEYVAKVWKKPSFEIWEEVKGTHFYTLMIQRRAMLDGASLAKRLKDNKNAEKYASIAKQMEKEIDTFWNPKRGYVTVTRNRVGGVDYKVSGLDAQIILASLHASKNDGFYTPESDRILATWIALVKEFGKLYPDNYKHPKLAPAIGRYPEDQYNGYTALKNGGNGWMLLTAAMAECLYKVKIHWSTMEEFKVTRFNLPLLRYVNPQGKYRIGQQVHHGKPLFAQTMDGLVKTADRFLARVHHNTKNNGFHLSEQWNRVNGTQQGAQDLTWSYVSFLTAYRARERSLVF